MERKTNWIAVIVAALVGMFLGFLWYGFIFQTLWAAGNGITTEGGVYLKDGVEMPMSATPMLFNTFGMFVYALLVNWLLGLTSAKTWMDGAKVGGAIGLIVAMNITIGNMFANDPASLSMVDGSYSLACFIAMGAILGGWQKK